MGAQRCGRYGSNALGAIGVLSQTDRQVLAFEALGLRNAFALDVEQMAGAVRVEYRLSDKRKLKTPNSETSRAHFSTIASLVSKSITMAGVSPSRNRSMSAQKARSESVSPNGK
jgi:hypothetical protein